jgi:hypothetical protein
MKINKNETRKSSREVNKGRKNEIEKNERKWKKITNKIEREGRKTEESWDRWDSRSVPVLSLDPGSGLPKKTSRSHGGEYEHYCRLIDLYRRFGVPRCLHVQGWNTETEPSKKSRYMRLHKVTYRKTAILRHLRCGADDVCSRSARARRNRTYMWRVTTSYHI